MTDDYDDAAGEAREASGWVLAHYMPAGWGARHYIGPPQQSGVKEHAMYGLPPGAEFDDARIEVQPTPDHEGPHWPWWMYAMRDR